MASKRVPAVGVRDAGAKSERSLLMQRSQNGRFTPESAVARIIRCGGKMKGRSIQLKRPGLKCLGAIDYMVNYRGHQWVKNREEDMAGTRE